MPYMRRLDSRNRKTVKKNPESFREPVKQYQESVKIESIKEPVPIPLPNEADITYNNSNNTLNERSITILDSIRSLFKGKISLEDIVIAALIFILIQDGCCDELLIILMFYILLG